MEAQAFYQPGAGSIEGLPMQLEMFYAHPRMMLQPHWHAQVEINYVMRGSLHYRMGERELLLKAGDMCLFWGGQPHQLDRSSEDSLYAGAHLPLVYFFRLRLPGVITGRLIKGETLLTSATDGADAENFRRWFDYTKSGVEAKVQHAIEELLLRIERIAFDPYQMTSSGEDALDADTSGPSGTRSLARMCDFIATNFLQEITSADIARAADLHPKYAMNLFKRCTGMTISKYVTLLRLSRAQAMLMAEGANVLQVAMDSGFGSISAFNKSFRHIAGVSPSAFRRDVRQIMIGGERGGHPARARRGIHPENA